MKTEKWGHSSFSLREKEECPHLFLAILFLIAPGCGLQETTRSVRSPLLSPQPFFVCIASVGETDDAAPAVDESRSVRAVPADGAEVARRIEAALEADNAFTRVEVLENGGEDAAARARELGADLLVRIDTLGEPVYRYSRRTGWFVPNTIVWFLLGFPSWFARDRVYEVSWDVEFSVVHLAADRDETRFPSVRLSQEVAVSVADQGVSWSALVTPPGFYEGPDLLDVLTPLTEEMLAAEVSERLEETPIEFEDVRIDPPTLEERHIVVRVRSRRPLEWFHLSIDGEPLPERTPLSNMPAPDPELLERTGFRVYDIPTALPSGLGAGTHLVRVLARDQRSEEVEILLGDPSPRRASAAKTFAVTVPARPLPRDSLTANREGP